MIEAFSNKDATFKKTSVVTPKRNSSFTNKSTLRPPVPAVSEFKMNLSAVSVSKTEREQSAAGGER